MPQFDSMVLPARLPLVLTASNRNSSTAKDAKLVNCFIETDASGETYIYKRPGIAEASEVAAGQIGRGVFYWDGNVYSIFGSTLYRDGISVGTSLNTTNGIYRFSSILGATPKMSLMNGAKAYAYWVAGGLTTALDTIDVDYPATTVKGWAYLNGAMYVMQPAAVIWGSVVNSISVNGDWSAINFISAQIEPDNGVALNRQLVYVIAFNEWSLEVFFDAGNATGSPLGNVQGSKQSYGCANQDSVQEIDDSLFWVSTNKTNSLQVAQLSQLTTKIISTKAIDRLLAAATLTGVDNVMSWQLKINGHSFYVLTIVSSNLTMAYDIVEDQWSQWTDTNGNYLPIIASTYDASNRHILQHATNGKLYYINSTYYNDAGVLFNVDIITPTFDGTTRRRKQLSMMEFIADQTPGSVLQVRCTDDDYQTWSNFRRVDLSNRRPNLRNCGTFSKRAYHLRHSSDTFFRIQAVEMQYDVGTL